MVEHGDTTGTRRLTPMDIPEGLRTLSRRGTLNCRQGCQRSHRQLCA